MYSIHIRLHHIYIYIIGSYNMDLWHHVYLHQTPQKSRTEKSSQAPLHHRWSAAGLHHGLRSSCGNGAIEVSEVRFFSLWLCQWNPKIPKVFYVSSWVNVSPQAKESAGFGRKIPKCGLKFLLVHELGVLHPPGSKCRSESLPPCHSASSVGSPSLTHAQR